jgi:dihydrofolate synthase/folylpolyglutamate synthase
VCVLTNVDLEHTAVLGSSHSKIALQKVGILKRGATMITGVAPNSAAGQIVCAEAQKLGCPLVFCLSQPGETIAEINTRLAKNVLDEIGRRSVTAQDPQFSKRRIGGWLLDEATQLRANLPGGMEGFELPESGDINGPPNRKSIPVILDGAHVPFNLAAVLRDLRRIRELAGFFAVVFAAGRDKQAFVMLDLLKQNRVDPVLCTKAASDVRAWTSHELGHFAEELGLATEDIPEPRAAMMRAFALVAGRGWVLVTGSLRLVGEIRSIIRELGAEPRRFRDW